MPGKAAFLEELTLDFLFALGSFASSGGLDDVLTITDLYVAIFKGDPEGAGTEVSGGTYARQPVAFGSGEWTRTGSSVVNDNDIDFGTATADWSTSGDEATHIAIFSDLAAGDMLYAAEMAAPQIILNGSPFSIQAGQAQFIED